MKRFVRRWKLAAGLSACSWLVAASVCAQDVAPAPAPAEGSADAPAQPAEGESGAQETDLQFYQPSDAEAFQDVHVEPKFGRRHIFGPYYTAHAFVKGLGGMASELGIHIGNEYLSAQLGVMLSGASPLAVFGLHGRQYGVRAAQFGSSTLTVTLPTVDIKFAAGKDAVIFIPGVPLAGLMLTGCTPFPYYAKLHAIGVHVWVPAVIDDGSGFQSGNDIGLSLSFGLEGGFQW